MMIWLRRIGQVAVVTAAFAAVATLASWPPYDQIPPDTAVIKLSFTHGSNREAECRRRTPEELAKLAPNMRKPIVCPRSRGNVYVELEIDGRMAYRASLKPSGVGGDGPARVYRRFLVPTGAHTIAARLRDTPRAEGFDYTDIANVALAPNQNFVIDFRSDANGFVFR